MSIEMTDKIREETKEFMQSAWCASRMHCTACQLPGEIHDNILNKWRPDLLCPEWGKPVEAIQKAAIVARAARPPCKEQRSRFAACPHGTVEKQLAFANAPCRGRLVTCTREGGTGVAYESHCTFNCKFNPNRKERASHVPARKD